MSIVTQILKAIFTASESGAQELCLIYTEEHDTFLEVERFARLIHARATILSCVGETVKFSFTKTF
jgi:hypothetical protein